jgi:hypothetical protein
MSRRIERRRPASYQDVRNLPEHLVGELIDGSCWFPIWPAGVGHGCRLCRM